MWPYWILFLIPAMVAISAQPARTLRADGSRRITLTGSWLLVLIVFILFIGLRDRVGGDWFNYFNYLFRAETQTVQEALQRADPAYELLNILSLELGLGVVGVNLFCGTVFSLGLIIYARSMPRPWLALAVAIPYLTVVVSMGYARQGVALGFAMIGLVALGRDRFLWFAFWVVLAASFHRSAVFLMSIALLNLDFRKFINLPILLLIGFGMYVAFLEDSSEVLIEVYIESEMQSDGAFIRLLMNAVPALLFLRYRKRFSISRGEYKTYSTMSYLSLLFFVALVAGLLPSTALDRMALYILPIQVFVFSSLPDNIGKTESGRKGMIFLILAYYTLVLLVWLNFANFSHWWLPYRMFPPLDIYEAYDMSR